MIALKKIVFLLLFVCSISFGQQKKYQSLLWEISGNGLEKNSYVYGSMHVSEKVSYHLSDAFFKHLLESDFVANESEPSSWSDLYDLFKNDNYINQNKFYKEFYLYPFQKQQLTNLFESRNYTMDNLLFRTNEYRQDFQEETYLDMFIYQTGRKYNKKTVGLEDAKKSLVLIMNIDYSDSQISDENTQKVVKILKNKSFDAALMDYYREKDLDMMDSLLTLISPEPYLDAMLYKRNITMTHSIDSIAKKGSLFAAIGAAHLPGKKGVIELLRQKGYTVKPIFDQYTDKGKNTKKQIDEYFIKPKLVTKSTADGFVEMPLFDMVIANNEDINSPDLANGGYINIKRKLLNNFLKKDKDVFNHLTLDSLFYENIPGDILEKKFFKEKDYLGYDIKNKTKTGNTQRYRFYITPLEIICINMIGTGEYVKNYENEVFNQIKLKSDTGKWETISPAKGGFSIQIPAYHILYGNKSESVSPVDSELYAHESASNSNYFLIERTLNRNFDLVETDFELRRIQEEFYLQYDAEKEIEHVSKNESTLISKSTINGKSIQLKTVINGPKYYLLGTVNASEEKTIKFFESFKNLAFKETTDFHKYTDSTGLFTVEIPKKQNEVYFLKTNQKKKPGKKDKKRNLFTSDYENYSFANENGQKIEVNFYKYHKYEREKNIDSVKADFTRWFKTNGLSDKESAEEEITKLADVEEMIETVAIDEEYAVAIDDYNYGSSSKERILFSSTWEKEIGFTAKIKGKGNKYQIISEEFKQDPSKKYYIYEALVSKPQAIQAIKYKVIFKDGLTYRIKTLVNKNYAKNDSFIERFYETFTPLDSVLNFSVFESKLQQFMTDARSDNDTIRYSALKSVGRLSFEKEELNDLQQFINTFNFKADELDALGKLFEAIGEIKDPMVIPFLERNYKKDNLNPIIQLAILKGLTHQESKPAYKKIMELLEYDLPLSESKYEISSLFSHFYRDPKNSAELFPDIFQFYSIPEYHDPIVNLSSILFDKGLINPKKLNQYKKMVLTNAKLEYKRVAGWKAKNDSKENARNADRDTRVAIDLKNYIQLIYPYKNEKDFNLLLNKIQALDIDVLNLEIAFLDLKKDNTLDKKTETALLNKSSTRFAAYQMLYDKKQFNAIEAITDEDLAKAGVIYLDEIDTKKDSLVFLEKREISFEGKTLTYFFFKQKPSKSTNDEYYDSYDSQEKLVSIAFVKGKNERLNPKAYYSGKVNEIVDEEKMEELYREIIDYSINGNRLRTSFGKIVDEQNMTGFYDYDEEYYEE